MFSHHSARTLTLGALFLAAIASGAIFYSGTGVKVSAATQPAVSTDRTPPPYRLTYSSEGDLTPPLQYREWVYLSSGLDMNYTPKAGDDMSSFGNTFVNPEAYRSFSETGTWPDKTVLVLEFRGAQIKGSINKTGKFQSGPIMGLEIHVKDEKRFPGKWAFFDVASESKATLIPTTASCYQCHQDHAAVDTTFVQFYPTLLPVAQKKNTLSSSYLKETAAAK